MRLVDKRELPINRGQVIHGQLLPSDHRRWDLGSSDLQWRTVYARSIVAQSITVTGGTGIEVHELASTSSLGAYHTVSGLTSGQVLRASGSTTAVFAQLSHSDLGSVTADQHHNQAHVITGADHTASGLTTGHVIRASGTTTFAFAQLQHTDLGTVSANQHHNQSHVIATTTGLGTDHTTSGLTSGQVLRASGSTTAAFAQLSHADLGSVSADQHHAGFIGLEDNSGTAVTPAADDRIQLTTGNNILSITAGTNTIGFTINQGNISHDSISGVSANDHHNQQHTLSGSDHTGDLLFAQIDSLITTPAFTFGTTGSVGTADYLVRSNAQIALFNDGATPESVTLSASATGDDAYPSRRDHTHQLSQSIAPTWTGTHTFQSDIQLGANLDFTGTRSITTDSTNNLTIAPGGDIIFDPAGNDLLPNTNYDINIGAINKKYLSLHAAELVVETLVAQNTMATIGGRILVGPTTTLTSDLSGDNMVLNPGFESVTGDDFDNWTEMEPDGTVEDEAVVIVSGSHSVKITTGTTTDYSGARIYQEFTVVSDNYYGLDFWARGDGTNQGRFMVYDVTNSAIITSGNHGLAASWAHAFVWFTTPADCVTIRVSFHGPGVNGGYAYFDDAALVDSTIYTKHNNLAVDDKLVMEANGNIEFFWTANGPSGSGPYKYGVKRDIDDSGENDWLAGDAVFNTGDIGDGFIDIFSTHGLTKASDSGPTIVGNIRTGTDYNDFIEHWAIGNLNGVYGYATDTYGVGLGRYDWSHIVIDPTYGIRFRDSNAVVRAQLDDDTWTLGVSTDNVTISPDGIEIYSDGSVVVSIDTAGGFSIGNGSTIRGSWQVDGDLFIGTDVSSPGTTYLSIFAGAQTYNSESMEAGDMLIGDNTSSKANILWDKSAGRLKIRGGTTTQAYIDTDGSFVSGSDRVIIDNTGITLVAETAESTGQIIWYDSTPTEQGGISNTGPGTVAIWGKNVSLYAGTTAATAQNLLTVNTLLRVDVKCDLIAWGGVSVGNSLATSPTDNHVMLYDTSGTPVLGIDLDGINGDIWYKGDLTASRTTEHTGYIFVPIAEPYTNTSFDGDSFSDVSSNTKIENTSWSSSISADAKALAIQIRGRDSGSAASTNLYFRLYSSSTATNAALGCRPSGILNDAIIEVDGIVPCDAGDIWYQCNASGTDTFDVWLLCVGYWV